MNRSRCQTLFVLLFCSGLIGWLTPVAGETPDIRHRAIVYFYPALSVVGVADLPPIPSLFERVDTLPDNAHRPVVRRVLSDDFQDDFPMPDPDYLSYFGHGLTSALVSSAQRTKWIVVLDFAYPQTHTVDGLKASNQYVYDIARRLGGLIWDSETRELFSAGAWQEIRLAAWHGKIPLARGHTVIHAYPVGEYVRAVTLGMAKLGLPDIVVNDFSWSVHRPMGDLINLCAQTIAEGVRASDRGTLVFDVDALADTEFKAHIRETLRDNAVAHQEMPIGEGRWLEGDPYNQLIEIRFDGLPGETLQQRQYVMLGRFFGSTDPVLEFEHNEAIVAASARARGELSQLRTVFQNGLSPGEFIQVKAPFATKDGRREWMWVEVTAWNGNEITGLLKNDPLNVDGLSLGSRVVVSEAEVFDYMRTYPDGTSIGNETGELMRELSN